MYSQKKTYTLDDATRRMERYCAYQERCHQEVRQKLITMHMIPEAVDLIMVHLLEHNFLNEERFARTYVSGKLKIKNWGRRRLTYELKKKDISETNINLVLAEIEDIDYIDIFNDLAKKKTDSIKETDTFKKRKKLIDYLFYKGWESDMIYEKAHELIP